MTCQRIESLIYNQEKKNNDKFLQETFRKFFLAKKCFGNTKNL